MFKLNLKKKKDFLKKFSKKKSPICCLTAYTANIAKIVDKYADIILVGDSVGPVLYGFKSTREVTMEMMIEHAKAVVKNSVKSIVVVDMPFGTYENGKKTALKNARKILDLTGAHAVKLEGGESISKTIKYLTSNKINVMGHLGMLPQKMNGRYRVYGKKDSEKKKLKKDFKLLEDAGVFSIVIECTLKSLVDEILQKKKVPTIGIGASDNCDGQILVTDDLIGMTDFESKFLKKYSRINNSIEVSIKKFCNDVKNKRYPKSNYLYK